MKKYNIIQIWERIGENTFKPCFIIVGQLYGYLTLEEAKEDKEKLSNKDHCVIMKLWW
jgi:hypothetical protein